MDENKPPQNAPKGEAKSEAKSESKSKSANDLPRKESPRTAPSPNAATLANLERTAMEIAGRSGPPQDKPTATAKPDDKREAKAEVKPEAKITSAAQGKAQDKLPDKPKPPWRATAFKLVEQYDLAAPPFSSALVAVSAVAPDATSPSSPKPATSSASTAPASQIVRPMFDDSFRLTLTPLQSAIAAVAISVVMFGAVGMAAYAYVVAHDWSCRVGLVEKYCSQPAPATKSLPLPEIPT